jgi:hypothetical protein
MRHHNSTMVIKETIIITIEIIIIVVVIIIDITSEVEEDKECVGSKKLPCIERANED